MTVSLSRKIKLAFALVVGAVLLATSPALAQRVSLNDLDAKLDQILAGQGGGSSFNIDDHVQLRLLFSSGTCAGSRRHVRVLPSGVAELNTFVVPAGKVLIITDVSWTVFGPFFVGRALYNTLFSALPNGSNLSFLFQSAPLVITTANQNARLGGSETLRAGIAVAAGRQVCGSAFNAASNGSSVSNGLASNYVRGVLVDE